MPKPNVMKKLLFFIALLMISALSTNAQDLTQTIRGKIVDIDSKFPLIGANVVVVSDTTQFLGAAADLDGQFKITGVSVGRQTLKVSFLGYQDKFIPVILTSAKEIVLEVEMEEFSTDMDEVVVTATKGGEVRNEMASISARSFTVEETDRYAGSRGDPARMASNFAGCQGGNDSRNDIIVRGNSPLGVLWRVEGVDIPNPNHFAISGSSGGPVNIVNNKIMSNSDFFTGAFPAEYGNSTSSVFDLKMRNGNNETSEVTAQLGLFGLEVMAEGPISKEKRSSYLFAYRYSTLAIFQSLGISLGTDAIPKYQDLSFKLNFPTKKGANFSVFGISGMSEIDILISEQKDTNDREFYGQNDRDQRFRTRMGILGASYKKSLNKDTYLRATIATSHENQRSRHDFVYRTLSGEAYNLDSTSQIMGFSFDQNKYMGSIALHKKIGKKNLIKFGGNFDLYQFNMSDTIRAIDSTSASLFGNWLTRWDYVGTSALIQPYVQWRHKFNDQLVLNVGIHNQYFSLSNSLSVGEPRIGLKWNFKERQSLSAGFGVHSQMQPAYLYTYHQLDNNGDKVFHNQKMDFSKSNHYIIGYDVAFESKMRMKIETYYQQLYDIPVEVVPSSVSMINQGASYSRYFPDSMQNTGTGTNYGLELTVEKFFSNNFFFLITGSVFDSKYTGSDGIERETSYNGKYALNTVLGKEFKVNDKATLGLGAKVTVIGGRPHGIVDLNQSQYYNEIIYQDSAFNSLRYSQYFRADLKINYKINSKKITHEIGFDLVNILGTKNILNVVYAPNSISDPGNPIKTNYQLGFLPIFFYKADIKLKSQK